MLIPDASGSRQGETKFWTTTYTELNNAFAEAADRAWSHLDTGAMYEVFGAGQSYTLDSPETAPELFAYMMGNNLDNQAADAAWYRR